MPQFLIEPNGVIKGGVAEYSIDEAKAIAAYSGQAKVGWGIFTRTLPPWSGTYPIDLSLLEPKNLTQGKVISVGNFQATVIAVLFDEDDLSISFKGTDFVGTATLLTGNGRKYAEVKNLLVNGHYDGFPLKVDVEPVTGIHQYALWSKWTSESLWNRLLGRVVPWSKVVGYAIRLRYRR